MRIIAIFLPLLFGACTTAPVHTTNAEPEQFIDTGASDTSLFSSDAKVLSDAAIAHILNYQWAPPERTRIAVMPFGTQYWFGWSEELAAAATSVHKRLTDQLSAAGNVESAAYLPSILTPSDRTVARLREAAARYQADLLLVYRSQCQSFEKYRLIRSRSRARCTIDALLLDTRTGLVPYSQSTSRSFDATRSDTDLTFRETVLRAQLAATSSALDDIAGQVVSLLDQRERP